MDVIDYKVILNEVCQEVSDVATHGNVTTTIPELAKVNPDKFGIHLTTLAGADYCLGDSSEKFSIQSISKALSVALAFFFLGEKIWKRVCVEPSGTAFNSLIQLEYEKGIPRNPFINAGALVIADMLVSNLKSPKEDFLTFIREISGTENVNYNLAVAQSEKDFRYRNAALANFLKSFGNIENDVDTVLDFYFHQCAIEMSCKELSHAFYFFANEGKTRTNKQVLSSAVK
jgi:glutaminase